MNPYTVLTNLLVRLVRIYLNFIFTILIRLPKKFEIGFIDVLQRALAETLVKNERGFLQYQITPFATNSFQVVKDEGLGLDTSVVISGLVVRKNSFTHTTVKLLKDLYSNLDIVIVLWPSDFDLVSSFESLGARVIRADEPTDSGRYSTNYQLRSVSIGLQNVSESTYVIRLRSDQRIQNPNFLSVLKSWHQLGTQKLHESGLFPDMKGSIVSIEDCAKLFSIGHIPDHFHFGFTSDLINLWSAPERTERESDKSPETFIEYLNSNHYVEQHLGRTMLGKVTKAEFLNWELHMEFIKLAFVLLDRSQLGLFWIKDKWWHSRREDLRALLNGYPYNKNLYLDSNMTHDVWLCCNSGIGQIIEIDLNGYSEMYRMHKIHN